MTQARTRRGSPSPQVVAGSMGGTVSFLFWTLAAKTFWKGTFDAASLAGLVSATTTLLSAGAGYVKHDIFRDAGHRGTGQAKRTRQRRPAADEGQGRAAPAAQTAGDHAPPALLTLS